MLHPCQRLLERFGIEMLPVDLRRVEARLLAGEGVVMRRWKDGTETILIDIGGTVVPAVFARERGVILTFLAPSAI